MFAACNYDDIVHQNSDVAITIMQQSLINLSGAYDFVSLPVSGFPLASNYVEKLMLL